MENKLLCKHCGKHLGSELICCQTGMCLGTYHRAKEMLATGAVFSDRLRQKLNWIIESKEQRI